MSDETIRIAFLDVGQGDTIVISMPDEREAVVVDCIDADAVIKYLKHENISTVRALVLTHLHADHYRQATAFLDNCERQLGARCEKLILNTLPEEEAPLPDDHSEDGIPSAARLTLYQQLNCWMHRNHLLVDSPHASVELPINGPLKQRIQFLHPFPAFLPSARAAGFNNSSIVLRVTAASTSALLTGDIEPEGWRLLKKNSATAGLAKGDVLKFPHHGAWKKPNGNPANVQAFLEEVGAKTAVISVGTEQKGYNHPDSHVFNAIRTHKVHLLCTAATKKCGGTNLINTRSKTTVELEAQADLVKRPHFFSSRGCPCAGTIVIDLNASVRIILPNLSEHRDQIVRKIFSRFNQCLPRI